MTAHEALDAYAAFFEGLSPASLPRLDALCTPEVRFRDPFNDVRGVAQFRAVLAKMFHDVAEPRFEVTDRAISSRACYLRWTFTFRGAGSHEGPRRIEGVSEIHLNAAGKVIAHIDHWDAGAQIYEQIPVLGSLVRMVKRRLSAAR
ncbi:MAG: nuclear transport factor 2 family protein [Alphaproteobacteria bacterium]|nr:nuclear transport factor 2 family protein [Alphaproteobacteria bacterium]